MKIKVNTKALNEGLKKVVSLKECSKIEEFNSVFITADNDSIILSKYDTTMNEIKLTLDSRFIEIEEAGTVGITLTDIKLISKIKEDFIIITENGIETNKKNLKMITLTVDVKPNTKDNICTIKHFTTDKEDILSLLQVKYAIAKDSARPILQGVNIKGQKWAALDGYRLSVRTGKYETVEEKSITAHETAITLLNKFIKKADSISLYSSEENEAGETAYNNFTLQFEYEGKLEIITRCLSGDYIKYKSIIPKERDNTLKTNRKELMEELEFINSMDTGDTKGNVAILENNFEKSSLLLHSRTEKNTLHTTLKCDNSFSNSKSADPFYITVNSSYILESLKNITHDIIYLDFYSRVSPIMISDNKHMDYNDFDMVLPVRIMNGDEWFKEENKEVA